MATMHRRMCMNKQNDTLYFLDRHVWQMSIGDTSPYLQHRSSMVMENYFTH